MADVTQIEDQSLAHDMANAEKDVRDKALVEANSASDKIKQAHDEMQKVREGFEGQSQVLFDRILKTENLPGNVAELFKTPIKKEDQYQLVGSMPYPISDNETKKQFSASLMSDLIKNMGDFSIDVDRMTGVDGQSRDVSGNLLDYLTMKSNDFPNLAINVGIVPVGNTSTRYMNKWKEPTLEQVLTREGSKVFKFDVIPVSTRQ